MRIIYQGQYESVQSGKFGVALLGPIETRLRFATNFLILSSSSGAKIAHPRRVAHRRARPPICGRNAGGRLCAACDWDGAPTALAHPRVGGCGYYLEDRACTLSIRTG